MNEDELKALEDELAALRPRDPSPLLKARLESAMEPEKGVDRRRIASTADHEPGPFRWDRWGSAIAAAAGLALALGVYFFGPLRESPVTPSPAETVVEQDNKPTSAAAAAEPPSEVALGASGGSEVEPRYRPVKAENVLKNRIDEGVIVLENGLSARRYRFQFVDTVVWEDPSNGSQFEISTPREEVVLVPMLTF